MSKKILSAVFVMALCLPVFAEDRSTRMYADHNEGLTTTAETIYTGACEVAYLVLTSTGTSATYVSTVRLLDSGTTMFAMTLGTAAQTLTIDLTNTPIYFGTSLIIDSSVVNAVGRSTVVYRKLK